MDCFRYGAAYEQVLQCGAKPEHRCHPFPPKRFNRVQPWLIFKTFKSGCPCKKQMRGTWRVRGNLIYQNARAGCRWGIYILINLHISHQFSAWLSFRKTLGWFISNLPIESSFTKDKSASTACSFVSKDFTTSLNETVGTDELKNILTSSYAWETWKKCTNRLNGDIKFDIYFLPEKSKPN